jgi:type II secretory pathway pseudopilin PulG
MLQLAIPRQSTPRTQYLAASASRQRGVYLLAIAILLGIAITLLAFGWLPDLTRQNTSERRSAAALEQAKQALIGYAATYRDTHPAEVFGYLPCPDVNGSNGEGVAASGCGSKDVTVIGRLPWRTLDLPPLRDGSGECLWYALSGNFKNTAKTDLMNWDTNGLIELMQPDATGFAAGAAPTNRAVALVFAPHAILPGQDRSLAATNPPTVCRGNYNVANYLDADAASGINNATAPSATANALSRFIAARESNHTTSTTDQFNDRAVALFPDHIFARRINVRTDLMPLLTDSATGMLGRIANCVAWYGGKNSAAGDRRLPWAAPAALSAYGTSTLYADAANLYSGRFPYIAQVSDVATNNKSVVSPDYRLLGLLGGDACPLAQWQPSEIVWENWKDNVFYAVAKAFAPNSGVASSADPCASDECLQVDGAGGIAAVIILADARSAGQSRNNDANPAYSSAEKGNPANYLEGTNLAAILNNSPSMATPRSFTNLANDTVLCVLKAGGSMVVDPTCNSPFACSTSADALAAYRSGTSNLCKVGTDKVLPTCKALKDKIEKNGCSCKGAARNFIERECITKGFTTAKCINAYNTLIAC